MNNIQKSDLSSQNNHHKHTNQLILVCFITLIYALCYQIQSPLEPYLIDKLVKQNNSSSNIKQVSGNVYAQIKTVFSIMQWFCSLGFGYLLDNYGVRVGYTVNFIACALCYYVLSISTSIQMLYLSKIPGIAMAGYVCSQAAVVKLTEQGSQRIKWLGLITTAYTIGGTFGPYIGGRLGSYGDYYTSGKYATYGSIFCLLLIVFLPKSLGQTHSRSSGLKNNDQFKKVIQIFKLCGFLLLLKFFTCLINSMRKSTQPLILKDLGVEQQTMGIIMASQFAFGAVTNAFLVPPVTRFFGGRTLTVVQKCLIATLIVSIFQIIIFLLPINKIYEIEIFVIISLFWSVFQYTLAVCSTCYTSSAVPKQCQGTLLGLESSIFAAGFMFGPQFGVKIWNFGGIQMLNWVVMVSIGILVIIGARKINFGSVIKQD